MHPFQLLDPERLSHYRQSLYHTIATLNQTIMSFNECYETEFQHWSDRPDIELNEVGPLCKRLEEQLVKMKCFLADVKNYAESGDFISNVNIGSSLRPAMPQLELDDLNNELEALKYHIELTAS